VQLLERGLVFDATKRNPPERVCAFTGLCRLRSGTIITGFQCGAAKHAINSLGRLARSRDGGRTWEDLGSPFNPVLGGVPGTLASADVVEPEPGRLLVSTTWFDRSDPNKPLFDPVTQGVLHCKQVCAESTDEGVSWSPWKVLPTPGLTGCAATGAPLRWADGTLAFAFESYKEFDDPKPGRHGAWVLLSRDGGRTFPQLHKIAQHPEHKLFYWDQRLTIGREPGSYYGLFWTHDLDKKEDRNVHFCKGSIHRTDNPQPVETNIPGQIAAPLLLPDGRLLGFVVDRHRPGTLKLWQSKDDGVTWPEKDALVVHTHDEKALLSQGEHNVDFNEYWEDMAKWTYGHPAIVQLDDSQVLLAFYAGTPGCLSIHWARVRV
jgi:hypothetical protein